MNPLLVLGICLAGGLGAGLRYLVDLAITRRLGGRFPWGILIVNITGSFALGVVAFALPEQMFLLGTGFLGGYTTFSTAMLDAVGQATGGQKSRALGHLLVTCGTCVLAAAAGLAIGSALA